jgi:hypothetical protein
MHIPDSRNTGVSKGRLYHQLWRLPLYQTNTRRYYSNAKQTTVAVVASNTWQQCLSLFGRQFELNILISLPSKSDVYRYWYYGRRLKLIWIVSSLSSEHEKKGDKRVKARTNFQWRVWESTPRMLLEALKMWAFSKTLPSRQGDIPLFNPPPPRVKPLSEEVTKRLNMAQVRLYQPARRKGKFILFKRAD